MIRLARERIGLPIIFPAVISWLFLFGYQWAFSLTYHGSQLTVFAYYSGILGDGILIPAANLGAIARERRQPCTHSRAWSVRGGFRVPMEALH